MNLLTTKIGARLGASFAMAIALALMLALLGAWQMSGLSTQLQQIQSVEAQKANLAGEWYTLAAINQSRAIDLAKSGNQASLAAYLGEEVKKTSARIVTTRKTLMDMSQDPDERALFARVQTQADGYLAIRKKAMDMLVEGNAEEAGRFIDQQFLPVAEDYLKNLGEVKTFMDKRVAQRSADSISASNRALWTMGIGGIAVLALAGWLAWSATHAVTKPLQQAVDVAGQIAAGDLTVPVTVDRRDEFGQLQQALGGMQASLSGIVSRIREGSEMIMHASSEVAQGNQDMSMRTENTASNLEETAASMEELIATVNQNADAARQAARLSADAATVAGRGGEVMSDVVQTIGRISDDSRRIADIITTIDAIAFQTNILALNAAVEAARAGEQGRGFAVVAGEVRSLAQRSAEAAKEIKTLISASVEKVDAGHKLVHRAGETMSEIVSQVTSVTSLIGQISSASGEQSKGIAQIGQAVQELDQATQQNAALVEQSAAAADSLQQQAAAMNQTVSVFRLAKSK